MQETRDMGSIPGSGRSPGGGNGNPLQYSCLENPMDRGSWWATVHGVTKSWTQLSMHVKLIFWCVNKFCYLIWIPSLKSSDSWMKWTTQFINLHDSKNQAHTCPHNSSFLNQSADIPWGWIWIQQFLPLVILMFRNLVTGFSGYFQQFLACFCCLALSHVQLFCDPMDCSQPGSFVYGISKARILEWVAISYSRDRTHVSCVSCIGRWILYHWASQEAFHFLRNLQLVDVKILEI